MRAGGARFLVGKARVTQVHGRRATQVRGRRARRMRGKYGSAETGARFAKAVAKHANAGAISRKRLTKSPKTAS